MIMMNCNAMQCNAMQKKKQKKTKKNVKRSRHSGVILYKRIKKSDW